MSRKPGTDKAAANQVVIKSLLKLPANRVCADCKRNKLPRWASWNLGIFICIRCSGIHRGMGTHISRVKSVDLDSWTDEQLQSMVKWGNNRANKYWESNLAPGHMPSEAKIENFIRTKYESKRWVMEGDIPNPSTLEESDDDNVPLKVVQKKLEQKSAAAAVATSAPASSTASSSASSPLPSSRTRPQQSNFDLIGGSNVASQFLQKPTTVSQTSTKPADSLLGLDFFAPVTSSPSSVGAEQNKMSSSRPDLNRSILSLYSSVPKPASKSQSPTLPSFGSTSHHHHHHQQPSALGDLNDSLNNLGFGALQNSTSATTPAKPSPFANLTAGFKKTPASPQVSGPGSGGFFGTHSAKPAPSVTSASSGLGDLFDFGAPKPVQSHPSTSGPTYSSTTNNTMRSLSFDADAWAAPAPTASTASTTNSAWGLPAAASSNAWCSSVSTSKPVTNNSTFTNNDDDWGDFGSGSTAPAVPAASVRTSTFEDDLFGNVWK